MTYTEWPSRYTRRPRPGSGPTSAQLLPKSLDRRSALPVPDGLVALSTRGPFSAESPEGVVLWTGRLDNDPAADAWTRGTKKKLTTTRKLGMPRYRVHFVDHGDNIYSTEHLEHDSDQAAIEEAHRRNVPAIGAGFDIWEDDRLVHRRNQCR